MAEADCLTWQLGACSVDCGVMTKWDRPEMQETRFDPWVGKIHWRRAWQPTPVFLPGASRGQRSLAGCSPQGHTESDTTEHGPGPGGTSQQQAAFQAEVGVAATLGSNINRLPPGSSHSGRLFIFFHQDLSTPPRSGQAEAITESTTLRAPPCFCQHLF